MTMSELLPCPFCGGEAAIEQTGRQELTLSCVGVQPSGLRGCGPKFVQKVKTHSLEWLAGVMAERWNQRAASLDEVTMRKLYSQIATKDEQIALLKAAINWCIERDDRNGSLPEAYREKLLAAAE